MRLSLLLMLREIWPSLNLNFKVKFMVKVLFIDLAGTILKEIGFNQDFSS